MLGGVPDSMFTHRFCGAGKTEGAALKLLGGRSRPHHPGKNRSSPALGEIDVHFARLKIMLIHKNLYL